MRYTPKERWEAIERAKKCGLTEDDAIALRRIALNLRAWFELECGTDLGCIERDEVTDKPYWTSAMTGKRLCAVADREKGAYKRLEKLMSKYPSLKAYVQTDCRGGTIYLCKPEDANGSSYNRGVFIA